MTDGILFILGAVITFVTVLAVLLVGRSDSRGAPSNHRVDRAQP